MWKCFGFTFVILWIDKNFKEIGQRRRDIQPFFIFFRSILFIHLFNPYENQLIHWNDDFGNETLPIFQDIAIVHLSYKICAINFDFGN